MLLPDNDSKAGGCCIELEILMKVLALVTSTNYSSASTVVLCEMGTFDSLDKFIVG